MKLVVPKLLRDVCIQNRYDDYVSFNVVSSSGRKIATYNQSACYADVMEGTNRKHDVRCLPLLNDGDYFTPLSNNVFNQWCRLCAKHGLMAKDTKINDKQECLFKRGNVNTMYAGLCCYRWSQNQPAIPWLVVRILKQNSKIHFYQALQYALHKYVTNTNHSFLPYSIGDAGWHCDLDYAIPAANILVSVLTSWFFKEPPETAKNGSVMESIEAYWIKLGFTPPDMGVGNKNKPFHLKSINDVLWDGWAALFDVKPEKDTLIETYTRIKENR